MFEFEAAQSVSAAEHFFLPRFHDTSEEPAAKQPCETIDAALSRYRERFVPLAVHECLIANQRYPSIEITGLTHKF